VLVRPGDSLWDLARSALASSSAAAPSTAQVAVAWPAWWTANRAVIGDNPDLLLPGTVLRVPTAAPPA
jgi:nucleoid-associated protein YgaU